MIVKSYLNPGSYQFNASIPNDIIIVIAIVRNTNSQGKISKTSFRTGDFCNIPVWNLLDYNVINKTILGV